jgi:hypothetical protein
MNTTTTARPARRTRVATALIGGGALLAVPLAVVAAPAATADAERTVRCGPGTAELSVDTEGRSLEVSADLDDVTPGSRWRLVLRQDGNRIAKVVRTADNEGDLDIERFVRNTRGLDTFAFRAKQLGGGACSTSVRA